MELLALASPSSCATFAITTYRRTEFVDLTERIESVIEEAGLRQAAILEALPLALYEARFDDNGNLTRRFVGGDVAKIAGEDTDALSSGELRWCDRIAGVEIEELERRLSSGKEASVTSHYRWSRSDGTTIHIIDQCVRSADADNAWVGTLIDVTAQRNQLLPIVNIPQPHQAFTTARSEAFAIRRERKRPDMPRVPLDRIKQCP